VFRPHRSCQASAHTRLESTHHTRYDTVICVMCKGSKCICTALFSTQLMGGVHKHLVRSRSHLVAPSQMREGASSAQISHGSAPHATRVSVSLPANARPQKSPVQPFGVGTCLYSLCGSHHTRQAEWDQTGLGRMAERRNSRVSGSPWKSCMSVRCIL
jgi:hypothetical protein